MTGIRLVLFATMTEFVDPRSNPEPPARVSREPAAHGEELRELVHLCAAGRVYDVERWIQAGKPIQAITYKRPGKASVLSPVRTAIHKKHGDLVLLLLCNGYRLGGWTSRVKRVWPAEFTQ